LAVMTPAGSSQAKRDTALKAHEHVPVNIHATFQASYMYMLQNLAKHMLAIDCRRSARSIPVLYASKRVAVTAQSGVLDVHVHGVVEHTWVDGVTQTLLEVVVFCGSVDLR
jgi:hypothetical protein